MAGIQPVDQAVKDEEYAKEVFHGELHLDIQRAKISETDASTQQPGSSARAGESLAQPVSGAANHRGFLVTELPR